MSYNEKSILSIVDNDGLEDCAKEDLIEEIILFRRALTYCKSQDGDDNCWMDYRHLLMRFLPDYDPERDDVRLDVDQLNNCKNFIACWQKNQSWECLGGDKGKTVEARTIGTLDCLKDEDGYCDVKIDVTENQKTSKEEFLFYHILLLLSIIIVLLIGAVCNQLL